MYGAGRRRSRSSRRGTGVGGPGVDPGRLFYTCMHMYRYDRAEVRIKGSATSLVAPSFELNQRVLLLHLGIRT
jgi:hypothetical protein